MKDENIYYAWPQYTLQHIHFNVVMAALDSGFDAHYCFDTSASVKIRPGADVENCVMVSDG